MPAARPGEVWMTDLGLASKVRPCLVLTPPPMDDELDVATVVAHTTSLRGNRWEIPVQKGFLGHAGAFDVQRIATVASVKFVRKLGQLTPEEFDRVLDLLSVRLGI